MTIEETTRDLTLVKPNVEIKIAMIKIDPGIQDAYNGVQTSDRFLPRFGHPDEFKTLKPIELVVGIVRFDVLTMDQLVETVTLYIRVVFECRFNEFASCALASHENQAFVAEAGDEGELDSGGVVLDQLV